MPRALPLELRQSVQNYVSQVGVTAALTTALVHARTLDKALAGKPVSESTILKLSRIAPKVRTADEFKQILSLTLQSPKKSSPSPSWSLEAIRGARDAQLTGKFKLPVRLAEASRTDDAIYTAYHNRISPFTAVATLLEATEGARGEAVARKALSSVTATRPTLQGIAGTLVNHGVAIGYVEHESNKSGTRVDAKLTEWPLEFVEYNPSTEGLDTQTRNGRVPITHGDGTWIVFRKSGVRPWMQEAAILPIALVWAAHANGLAYWNATSKAHGLAKLIGELPEGVSLGAEGALTPEATAFLTMMRDIVMGDSSVGIRPAGSKTEFVSNGSTAWQIFTELVQNREKAAARVYLGTDAILGSVGGAPGVDISLLFGVASTKVQGDFEAIESGLRVGLYEPWAAINEGSSRYAPTLRFQMPDPDASRKSEERFQARKRLFDTLTMMRSNSVDITQEVVDALAKDYGVDPTPQLQPAATKAVPLQLAPTDLAKVVRVREARASQGLPLIGNERDNLFLPELDALATAAPPAAPPTAPPPTPTP